MYTYNKEKDTVKRKKKINKNKLSLAIYQIKGLVNIMVMLIRAKFYDCLEMDQ